MARRKVVADKTGLLNPKGIVLPGRRKTSRSEKTAARIFSRGGDLGKLGSFQGSGRGDKTKTRGSSVAAEAAPLKAMSKDYARLLKEEQWREKKRKNDEADDLLLDKAAVVAALSELASGACAALDSIGPRIKSNFPEIDQILYDTITDIVVDVKRSMSEIRITVGSLEMTGHGEDGKEEWYSDDENAD